MPDHTDQLSDRLLSCSVGDEEARVVRELEDLEEKGVVAVEANGRFTVQGGRAAAIALKYQARSFAGPDTADKPFDIPFVACVGEPLANECARRAAGLLPDAARLAWFSVLSPTTVASGARLRAAIDTQPFAGLDADAAPFGRQEFDSMAGLIGHPGDPAVAVVNFTLSVDGEELNRVEVWSVPSDLDNHQVNQALSDAIDDWKPLVTASEMDWNGAHAVVLDGDEARRALCQLCPQAAARTLRDQLDAWSDGDRADEPEAALGIAQFTVDALRTTRHPDRWDLSPAYSHLGFVLSLFDDRLEEAQVALAEARDRGPADGWVTEWNLANIAARLGDFDEAKKILDSLREPIGAATTGAFVALFIPGRPPRETMVITSPANGESLRSLQIAVLDAASDTGDAEALRDALEQCAESDPQAMKAAKWAADLLAAKATADRDTP